MSELLVADEPYKSPLLKVRAGEATEKHPLKFHSLTRLKFRNPTRGGIDFSILLNCTT